MQKTISIFLSAMIVLMGAGCTNSPQTNLSVPAPSADTSIAVSDASDMELNTQQESVSTDTPISSPTQSSKPPENVNNTSPVPSTQGGSVSTDNAAPSSSPVQNSSPAPITNIPTVEQDTQTEDEAMPTMKIQIVNTSFTAILYNVPKKLEA